MLQLSPPRRPFVWLLVIDLTLWQAVAWWMWLTGKVIYCVDDSYRAIIAIIWSRAPFWRFASGTWLPLPFYIYGSWHWLVGRHMHWAFWYLPAGALMTGLAATFIGWAGMLLAREGRDDRPCGWGLVGLAALAPMLIRDNWRVAPTPLSEPPYLMFFAATAALLAWQARRRPAGPRFWIPLALALIALQMTRYEGFPLAFAAWGLACLAYPWPTKGRWRRMAIGLAAGLVVLMLFPLAWMLFNRSISGKADWFVQDAWGKAMLYTPFSILPPVRRLGLMLRWMRQQNGVALLASLAGLWLGRDRRAMIPIVGLMLAAWIVSVAIALCNAIGPANPSRYALAFAWACLPPIVLLGGRLWSGGRVARSALLLAIAAFIGFGLPSWIATGWGAAPRLGDDEAQALASLERLVRRDHYKLVFDYGDDSELDMARLYCDPDNVTFVEQYSIARPARGRFLFLHRPDGRYPGHKAGEGLEREIDYFAQMPPEAKARPLPPVNQDKKGESS